MQCVGGAPLNLWIVLCGWRGGSWSTYRWWRSTLLIVTTKIIGRPRTNLHTVRRVKRYVYETSPAIWDYTVLPADVTVTPINLPVLTPTKQAGIWLHLPTRKDRRQSCIANLYAYISHRIRSSDNVMSRLSSPLMTIHRCISQIWTV